MKEKTLQDYKKLIEKVIEKYKERQMNSGLKFIVKENKYDTSYVTYVTNSSMATKIMYDEDIKHIVTRDIFMSDVDTLLQLRSELKGDK